MLREERRIELDADGARRHRDPRHEKEKNEGARPCSDANHVPTLRALFPA
jgi:hypothetical protein